MSTAHALNFPIKPSQTESFQTLYLLNTQLIKSFDNLSSPSSIFELKSLCISVLSKWTQAYELEISKSKSTHEYFEQLQKEAAAEWNSRQLDLLFQIEQYKENACELRAEMWRVGNELKILQGNVLNANLVARKVFAEVIGLVNREGIRREGKTRVNDCLKIVEDVIDECLKNNSGICCKLTESEGGAVLSEILPLESMKKNELSSSVSSLSGFLESTYKKQDAIIENDKKSYREKFQLIETKSKKDAQDTFRTNSEYPVGLMDSFETDRSLDLLQTAVTDIFPPIDDHPEKLSISDKYNQRQTLINTKYH